MMLSVFIILVINLRFFNTHTSVKLRSKSFVSLSDQGSPCSTIRNATTARKLQIFEVNMS